MTRISLPSVIRFLVILCLSALLVVVVMPSFAQQPANLLNQGKQFYQTGKFTQAATLWQLAASEYAQQGETLNQAQALNYLSLAHQALGQWEAGQRAIKTSLSLLQTQTQLEPKGMAILAQALNTQGSWQLAQAQTLQALETWQQAEIIYQKAGNTTGKWGSQINQAQALRALGQHRRAEELLDQVHQQLQNQPDSLLKADALRSLGIALQTLGNFALAKDRLEQSWDLSEKLGANVASGTTLFSLGNLARDVGQNDVALLYYQNAAQQTQSPIAHLEAQLNQLSLLVTACKSSFSKASDQYISQLPTPPAPRYPAYFGFNLAKQEVSTPCGVKDLIQGIPRQLAQLSPSRDSVYAQVNFAATLLKLSSLTQNLEPKIAPILATAVQQARQIQDLRAQAYALIPLGQLYSQTKQWQEAQQVTQQALQLAQTINAKDLLALASGQLGNILQEQGNLKDAIAAYRSAVITLQTLRSDLVAINSEVQFSFREAVEPIYRQLVSLLLQPQASQREIKEARDVIEALQLAELDNFFREACLETNPVQIDNLDTQAAVIYPIILPDRLEVIVSIPQQPLKHYPINLPSQEIEAILQKFYSSLYLGYSEDKRLSLAQKIYSWLIEPANADFNYQQIQTLVFVLDGLFKNIPMGALYDGKQYLIEQYSIALSPGLQLFPQRLERQKIKAITAGLTQARQGFPPLPGVEVEIAEIASEVNSQVLIDQDFTRTTFVNQVDKTDFSVVHLATHGQFSSNLEDTFLLTWNDQIQVKDFDRLVEQRGQGKQPPIELLVLSACQTAVGDQRAALGLAGFALRSGARSTLATIWSVSDQSTAELMSEFYRQLTQPNQVSKAQALRQAQLKLLKNPLYHHPYFWAPFVLVGNWL